ncbi:MAG: hypothetical protein EP330_00255 [Deltaproteobacteria bacterium]|nr:MAG: hypothetical protein EP330_00255 [Deltaproteobacteria bacterium]
MPELSRRTFLGLAVTAAAAPTDALASVPAAPPRPLDEAMPGVLAQEEALLTRPFSHDPADLFHGWTAEQLLRQSMATALWAGHYRSLTPEERDTPEVQAMLAERKAGMGATLIGAAAQLDALDRETAAELDLLIAESPEVFEEARSALFAHAEKEELPKAVKKRFDRCFEDLEWKIQKQGMFAVAQAIVGKFDRLAAREGLDWRAAASTSASVPFRQDAQPTNAGDAIGALVLLALGIGAVYLGLAIGPIAGWFVVTLGVLLILGALITAIIAGRLQQRRQELAP